MLSDHMQSLRLGLFFLGQCILSEYQYLKLELLWTKITTRTYGDGGTLSDCVWTSGSKSGAVGDVYNPIPSENLKQHLSISNTRTFGDGCKP